MPRTTIPLLVAALTFLVLPADATAARAYRSEGAATRVVCSNLHAGAGSAWLAVVVGDDGDGWAELAVWLTPTADPEQEPPTWNGVSSSVALGSDGSTLSASIELFAIDEGGEEPGEPVPSPSPEPTGAPTPAPSPIESESATSVGEASLSATLDPVGDPESYGGADRYGNRQYRYEASYQALAVSGTLTLPNDVVVDLAGCEATRETYAEFANAPSAGVSHSGGVWLSCDWVRAGEIVSLSASADGGANGALASASLWIEDPSGEYAGWSDAALTGTAFDTTLDLYSMWDEPDDAVGSASASATVSRGARINETDVFDGGRFRVQGSWLTVAGSMTVTTAAGTRTYELDNTSCQAADVRLSELPGRPARGPSGEPIANDGPKEAVLLAIGDVATVSTTGAEPEPEAPCIVEGPDSGGHEVPFGSTLWWTFTGTGGPVTLDTAGSEIDTVLAVYSLGDGDLVPVACVDDTEDGLQARVTIETSANTTYLVQAGGFGGASGALVLAISEP
jgi:hypothetical protein